MEIYLKESHPNKVILSLITEADFNFKNSSTLLSI